MNEVEQHRIRLLIQSIRGGDGRAFDELVRLHHARVWRFILKYVANRHDAEELAQETFLVAWRSFNSFRGDSRFSTWLLGIALNLARNHCNRAPSRREIELPEPEQLDTIFSEAQDPYEQVRIRHQLQALRVALEELPADLREVVILVRLEGLALEEAALLLEVPLGTVKSRLSRARSRLNEALCAHLT